MNPVLILTRNCLKLTKLCVESALSQDVETQVLIFDNGSTDGTLEWAKERLPKDSPIANSPMNLGVSHGWNFGLSLVFSRGASHCLVVNNDTVLPPWFYSELLAHEAPFVTGVSVGSMDEISGRPPRKELIESPDFSAFLIRRECWEKVGPFDESMVNYASDLDYHIRAWRKGVHLMNAGVPFYHERSSTLNNASQKDRRMIELQAEADRATLEEKWGCRAWDASYEAMFDLSIFGVDADEASQVPQQ